MAISVKSDNGKNEATLIITERFTFDHQSAFTAAYKSLDGNFGRYVLDLYRVEYIDSAALGMLLRLKEHLGAGGREIIILTKPGTVTDVLQISQFDRLFQIRTTA